MNDLASLGIILLLALLVGHLVKFARLPEVTGYLLAGVLVGPSGLRWVSHDNLDTLKVFSEVGLGLILFSIGASFEFNRFRNIGRKLVLVTLGESLSAAALVFFGMLAVGQSLRISLVLAAIAIETGAASTLMVMRETDSKGPVTETLTGVIGLNNVLALIAFTSVVTAIQIHELRIAGTVTAATLYGALFPLFWQFAGSAALGFLVGLALSTWGTHIEEASEMVTLLVGCVLFTVGVSTLIGASSLVASLVVGGTMANLSRKSRTLFRALSHTDPPLYVIFFVLAGAELDLTLLPSLGVVGLVYVLARTTGKFFGAAAVSKGLGMHVPVQKNIGFALFAQAGLAIGLVLIAREQFPENAALITTIVLGGVAIFEMFGPVSAKFALTRSGEVPRKHGST